jgi:hypothetical protein
MFLVADFSVNKVAVIVSGSAISFLDYVFNKDVILAFTLRFASAWFKLDPFGAALCGQIEQVARTYIRRKAPVRSCSKRKLTRYSKGNER